jgi:PAS domain S-box-containing protein
MKFDDNKQAIDYRLAEINPAFERQTGLRGAAGQWVSEAAPGLERHWFDTYGRVALTGEPVRFENRAEPFGRWYDVHAFRAGEAQERRVAILFNDITERRDAEDRLRELNETLEQQVAERTADRDRLWRSSQDMLLIARFDGTIVAANPAWTAILGWSEAELVGANFMELIHPDDLASSQAEAARLAAEGRTNMRFENRYRAKGGSGSGCPGRYRPAPGSTMPSPATSPPSRRAKPSSKPRRRRSVSRRRWRRSASSPAASRTTSTTCSRS